MTKDVQELLNTIYTDIEKELEYCEALLIKGENDKLFGCKYALERVLEIINNYRNC